MKNKNIFFALGGAALVAIVAGAIYFSSGALFKAEYEVSPDITCKGYSIGTAANPEARWIIFITASGETGSGEGVLYRWDFPVSKDIPTGADKDWLFENKSVTVTYPAGAKIVTATPYAKADVYYATSLMGSKCTVDLTPPPPLVTCKGTINSDKSVKWEAVTEAKPIYGKEISYKWDFSSTASKISPAYATDYSTGNQSATVEYPKSADTVTANVSMRIGEIKIIDLFKKSEDKYFDAACTVTLPPPPPLTIKTESVAPLLSVFEKKCKALKIKTTPYKIVGGKEFEQKFEIEVESAGDPVLKYQWTTTSLTGVFGGLFNTYNTTDLDAIYLDPAPDDGTKISVKAIDKKTGVEQIACNDTVTLTKAPPPPPPDIPVDSCVDDKFKVFLATSASPLTEFKITENQRVILSAKGLKISGKEVANMTWSTTSSGTFATIQRGACSIDLSGGSLTNIPSSCSVIFSGGPAGTTVTVSAEPPEPGLTCKRSIDIVAKKVTPELPPVSANTPTAPPAPTVPPVNQPTAPNQPGPTAPLAPPVPPAPTTAKESITTIAGNSCANFKDVEQTHPLCPALQYAREQGIFAGYPDGTFRPNDVINRAEAVKVILIAFRKNNLTYAGSKIYSDTEAGAWYSPYLRTGEIFGITGYPNGTFGPNQQVSKVELLKMFFNISGRNLRVKLDEKPYNDVPIDTNTLWYLKYVQEAKKYGLIRTSKEGLLYPAAGMLRGDVAELFYRYHLAGLDK